jgi:glucosamine--fructose-6-phosphate aminotransferase (isomerizing)
MCGIVGYVGPRDALEVVLNGLRLLEYRGYDSAGVAVIDRDGALQVAKKAGRIENLQKELGDRPINGRAASGTLGGQLTVRPTTAMPTHTLT